MCAQGVAEWIVAGFLCWGANPLFLEGGRPLNPEYQILVTDGEDNCNSAPQTGMCV